MSIHDRLLQVIEKVEVGDVASLEALLNIGIAIDQDKAKFRDAVHKGGNIWEKHDPIIMEVPKVKTGWVATFTLGYMGSEKAVDNYFESNAFLVPDSFKAVQQAAAARRVKLGLKAEDQDTLLNILQNNPEECRAYLEAKFLSTSPSRKLPEDGPVTPAKKISKSEDLLTNKAIEEIRIRAAKLHLGKLLENAALDKLDALEELAGTDDEVNFLTQVAKLNFPADVTAQEALKLLLNDKTSHNEIKKIAKDRKEKLEKDEALTQFNACKVEDGNILGLKKELLTEATLGTFLDELLKIEPYQSKLSLEQKGLIKKEFTDVDEIKKIQQQLCERFTQAKILNETIKISVGAKAEKEARNKVFNAADETELKSALKELAIPGLDDDIIDSAVTKDNFKEFKVSLLQKAFSMMTAPAQLGNVQLMNKAANLVEALKTTDFGADATGKKVVIDFVEERHCAGLKKALAGSLSTINESKRVADFTAALSKADLRLGIEVHEALVALYKQLPPSKQEELLTAEKIKNLRHVINVTKSDEPLKRFFGTESSTSGTTLDFTALLTENKRNAAFKQIYNPHIAKALASLKQPALADKINLINQDILYNKDVDLSDRDNYIAFVKELIKQCNVSEAEEVKAFRKALGVAPDADNVLDNAIQTKINTHRTESKHLLTKLLGNGLVICNPHIAKAMEAFNVPADKIAAINGLIFKNKNADLANTANYVNYVGELFVKSGLDYSQKDAFFKAFNITDPANTVDPNPPVKEAISAFNHSTIKEIVNLSESAKRFYEVFARVGVPSSGFNYLDSCSPLRVQCVESENVHKFIEQLFPESKKKPLTAQEKALKEALRMEFTPSEFRELVALHRKNSLDLDEHDKDYKDEVVLSVLKSISDDLDRFKKEGSGFAKANDRIAYLAGIKDVVFHTYTPFFVNQLETDFEAVKQDYADLSKHCDKRLLQLDSRIKYLEEQLNIVGKDKIDLDTKYIAKPGDKEREKLRTDLAQLQDRLEQEKAELEKQRANYTNVKHNIKGIIASIDDFKQGKKLLPKSDTVDIQVIKRSEKEGKLQEAWIAPDSATKPKTTKVATHSSVKALEYQVQEMPKDDELLRVNLATIEQKTPTNMVPHYTQVTIDTHPKDVEYQVKGKKVHVPDPMEMEIFKFPSNAPDSIKAVAALDLARLILTSRSEIPSAEHQLILEGVAGKEDEVKFLWAALVYLGEKHPNMHFSRDAIQLSDDSTCNWSPSEERGFGRYKSDSTYRHFEGENGVVANKVKDTIRLIDEKRGTQLNDNQKEANKELKKQLTTEKAGFFSSSVTEIAQETQQDLEAEGGLDFRGYS
ncbi:MAG: hypothetical protein ACRCXC_08890 [Legionella sp.]